MKNRLKLLVMTLALSVIANAGTPGKPDKGFGTKANSTKAEKMMEKFNQGAFTMHPFGFMENKGQITGPDGSAFPEAKFEFQQGNTKIFLLENGIAYQFTRTHYPDGYLELLKKKDGKIDKEELKKLQKEIKTETYRMDMRLQGANKHPELVKEGQSTDVTNFYNSNVLNVGSYDKITYKDVYPGIDWVIYTSGKASNGHGIKYDFVVKPGADPSLINMEFKHQEKITLNADGSFTLKNTLGEINEKAPVSFQNERTISTAFILSGNILSFELENYDHSKELIIDPSLIWATYYGNTGNDAAYSCATDVFGNVYLAGETTSTASIAAGGHQNTFGGVNDVFLVKFNSSGVRQWSTYYGGTDGDGAGRCACDLSGNVYLLGTTESTANIASGGYQNTIGGSWDAFLIKFNSSGVRQWGTYYGGAIDDAGYSCATDASGNVYIAGTTPSPANIASGGHQNSFGGDYDAFLVKFSGSGVRQWATYYGGAGYESGGFCSIEASTGNVYLGGTTASTANIASGGYQNTYAGGTSDAFLVMFNSSGVRQWATYYGDSNSDLAYSCSADAFGNVYLAGYTASTANITSAGHQNTYGGGGNDAFLVKFSNAGVRQWATYYGGTNDDWASTCAADASGNVYLAGYTWSAAGIASGGYQNTVSGVYDAYLVKFNSSGVRQWGTYYGGTGADYGRSCATGSLGNVYIAGMTASTASIASGGHQNNYGGGFSDAFLVAFCENAPAQASGISGNTVSCSGINQSYSVTSVLSATSYSWSYSGTAVGSSTTNTLNLNFSSGGVLTVVAINGCGVSPSQTLGITVNTTPTVSVNSGSICSGNNFTIVPGGASTFTITGGSNIVNPSSTTAYSVTGTSAQGCVAFNTAVSNLTVHTTPTVSVNSGSFCTGTSFTIIPGGASTYTITGGSAIVSPTSNASYSITGTSAQGCVSGNTAVSSVTVNITPTVSANSGTICSGKSFTILPGGASVYTISGGSTIVSPVSNTIYLVTGTSAQGCVSGNTAVSTVTVYTTPTVGISSTGTLLCSGQTTTLTGTGANTYSWAGGPASAVYTVSPSASTSYTVTGTTSASGCTNVAVQSIAVNATPTVNISSSSTVICSGLSVTLTATGANTYIWTNGPPSNAIIVSPTVTTNYTVTGTSLPNGCTNVAVQSISVNTSPTLNISSSSTVMCSGLSATLIASGANSYIWTSGPSSATFVVSPAVTTIYTVTGTSSVSGCTNVAVQSISVNATPTLTISASSTLICSGQTTTLTGSGASNYLWTSGPPTAINAVSPAGTTIYTVTGTNSASGCTNVAVQSISVNTTPTVTIIPSSTVICSGKTVTLTATGATTYLWSNGPGSATYTVNPLANTNYTVTGTTTNCSNTAIQSISVNPNPTISVSGSTFVCANSAVILTAAGATSYTWNTSGPTGSNLTVSPSVTSTYSVTGANANNCVASATFQVNTTSLVTPTLCLVTVDSASINNEIYWDKSNYLQADTFIVLRETSSLAYTPIVRISKNAFSSYIDTNRSVGAFNGNPNFSFYKYKLQYRDTCGNLSAMSPFHQSIYIQDAQTGNFSWNYYFIEGIGNIQTASYVLLRRNIITGVTATVGATSANVANDPLYSSLSLSGNVKWFVNTEGFACNPSLKPENKGKAGKTGTKSNSTNERQFPIESGIGLNRLVSAMISIYPNPVANRLKIDFGKAVTRMDVELMDIAGRIVFRESFSGASFELNTELLNNGIYFVRVSDDGKTVTTKKVIVQHQ